MSEIKLNRVFDVLCINTTRDAPQTCCVKISASDTVSVPQAIMIWTTDQHLGARRDRDSGSRVLSGVGVTWRASYSTGSCPARGRRGPDSAECPALAFLTSSRVLPSDRDRGERSEAPANLSRCRAPPQRLVTAGLCSGRRSQNSCREVV